MLRNLYDATVGYAVETVSSYFTTVPEAPKAPSIEEFEVVTGRKSISEPEYAAKKEAEAKKAAAIALAKQQEAERLAAEQAKIEKEKNEAAAALAKKQEAEKLATERAKSEKAQEVRDVISKLLTDLDKNKNAKFPPQTEISDLTRAAKNFEPSSVVKIERLQGVLARFKIEFDFNGEHKNAKYHDSQRNQILSALNQMKDKLREMQKGYTQAMVSKSLGAQPAELKAAKQAAVKPIAVVSDTQPKPMIAEERRKPTLAPFKVGNYKAALERSAAQAAAAQQAQATQSAAAAPAPSKP